MLHCREKPSVTHPALLHLKVSPIFTSKGEKKEGNRLFRPGKGKQRVWRACFLAAVMFTVQCD